MLYTAFSQFIAMVWQDKPSGVVLRPEDITAGMNMFQIENEFRKKVTEVYWSDLEFFRHVKCSRWEIIMLAWRKFSCHLIATWMGWLLSKTSKTSWTTLCFPCQTNCLVNSWRGRFCHFQFCCLLKTDIKYCCRLGVKASGKISWEYFLEKFQDSQGPGNGQTIPIKPAHKWEGFCCI